MSNEANTNEALIKSRISNFSDAFSAFQILQSGISLNLLNDKGLEFEYIVIRIFELSGYKVRYSFGSSLEQIDGIVYTDVCPLMIESKNYSEAIDIEPIAKLLIRLQTRPPNIIGCVFSMNSFTSPALVYSEKIQQKNLILWDGNDIFEVLLKATASPPINMRDGFSVKYCALIENGFNMKSLAGAI
jgi:hypothetical protein